MERRARHQALDRMVPTQRRAKGGILKGANYKNYTVNIRPSRWDDKNKPSQFWIGKISSFERAQQIADAIYFYVDKPPFHIKDVVRWYPSITCMGRVSGAPEVLSTPKMFRSYTSAIAKGVNFKLQREDFIAQVERVINMDEFPFPAPPQDDVEQVEEEGIPEMEYDDSAAMALSMSSNGVPAPVRPESVSFAPEFSSLSGVDSVQGFLPGFDVQPGDSASILRSEGQSIGSISLPESMDECPASQDDEGFPEWNQSIDGLNHLIAAVPSVVSDGEVHHQESYELISPILMIPPSVSLVASSIFEPPVASVAPEERADTAPGNPEDWQLARKNVKRRKIAGRSHMD
jgi:hypothetical protein